MRQYRRVRAIAIERKDLHPAEGLIAGMTISLLLWSVLLLALH